eukprot:TRINITY_DN11311_c0_g1_i3.p1 TRINITY_DN11311_c0_g1~~TRINITY_DN11311_c0_g1_i3.p1  ORF type:complete len:588 (-),score=97.00 TRINITY_DN11311_c0_g1_i3:215-1762(-)
MVAKFAVGIVRSRIEILMFRIFGGIVDFADSSASAPLLEGPGPMKVSVVRTSKHSGERFCALPPLDLEVSPLPEGAPAVVLDASMQFQTFLGFGGSFTESSANVLQSLSPSNQERVIQSYFDRRSGLGYRLGRLHMNSCDFSTGNWSCAETPDDHDLKHFTIDRYRKAILPMIERASKVAGEALTLIASPWSPPRWMKDTGKMCFGGRLKSECRAAWAKHYVRFAEEMQKAGVKLWGFTVQNEPLATTPWENCLYAHEEERDFVRDFLGPALEQSDLDLKLLVWDHNRDDMYARARAIFSDPIASKYVWGTGYHWYGDPRHEAWPPREGMVCFDNLQRVHELRPDKHIIMTEACQELGPKIGDWSLGERYGEAIIRDLNNWLEGWIDWNLLLDVTGGPNHVQNLVSAPIIADVARDKILFLSSFFYIGHFSRHIQPGARRISAASNRDALEVVAFANPDGCVVAIVMNRRDHDIDFYLQNSVAGAKAENLVTSASAPARSISTFTFHGSPFERAL